MPLYQSRSTGGVIAVTICVIALVLVVGGWIVAVLGGANIQEAFTTLVNMFQNADTTPGA